MTFRTRGLALLAAVGLVLCHCGALAQIAGSRPTIRSLVAQAATTALQARPYDGRGWLERFYAPRAYAPAWSAEHARQALALLGDAPAHGLALEHYVTDALLREAAEQPSHAAELDVAMTSAMLRFVADLRFGRVRSDYFTALPDLRLRQFDPVETLRAALAAGRLGDAVAAAEPRFPMYAPVRAALVQYRELARQPQRRVAAPAEALAPGARYRGAAALHARLVLLGDLATDAAPSRQVYNKELAEAVRRFQSRHGLEPDGILGPATVAALQVPLAQRVRQLELTLERLRWLPDFPPGRLVAVNLPAYRLWAWDSASPDTGAELEMRVIVGEAVKTPTPLFIGQMRYVEFNPYWNVPRSITVKEMIPKLESDPGWLAQNDMELVPVGSGATTRAVNQATLSALQAGKYRLRQRPGPKNALGAVKFMLPNPMDIYLHSTSERALFKRTRRDLSHGCIRVEEPVALARFVLGDAPEWTADNIAAAMAPGPTVRVDLPVVVPVLLFYTTALTDRAGRVLFARDVYGRDRLLEEALAGRRARVEAQIVPSPPPPRE
jgi:murein L,D-transpeptidase YcbB/YkuD